MITASQPPHGAQIRMAMTVSGLMMAHQVAGKATRDAIFLSQFKTTAMPAMVATLEHLFTLLALLLPADAVRIAFRALHTDDRLLQGTAFEYLESATPAPTRHLLLPLLEVDAQRRNRSRAAGGELANLLATRARVNETLKLDPRAMESRR